MELLNGGPLYKCLSTDGGPTELAGEKVLHSVSIPNTVSIKVHDDADYFSTLKLCTTSHRIYYTSGHEAHGVRFDTVLALCTRGGLLKPKKLVIQLRDGTRSTGVSIRISDKAEFDSCMDALTRALRDRAWVASGGFIPRAVVGGLARVMARVENAAIMNTAVLDAGLSDLESLRSNAEDLVDLISRLKRGGDKDETNEIDRLLKEFGLMQPVKSTGGSSGSDAALPQLVDAAITAANGVLLIHDLYCLVNRKLKLEKLFSPPEFLAELKRMPSVQLLQVMKYVIVLNRKLVDVDSVAFKVLSDRTGQSLAELAQPIGIGNEMVLNLVLLKVEETYGRIARDEDRFGSTKWYLNII